MKGKWIRAAIFCSSFFLLTGCLNIQEKPKETKEVKSGIEKIESLNAKSVSEVQKEIQTIKEKRQQKQENDSSKQPSEKTEPIQEEKNYKTLFQNCLILGDSLAEGFLDGDFLDPIHVQADRGKAMYQMEEQVDLVRSLAPERVFLVYGMNDLAFCNGDANLFKERYQTFLEQLKEVDPSIKIYVNLIFPVQERILEERPEFQHIDEFNQALIELGQEMDIPVLDNHSLVTEEEYEPDGIHLKISFYPKWLNKMVEEAKLQ